jgi:hypothetical protein
VERGEGRCVVKGKLGDEGQPMQLWMVTEGREGMSSRIDPWIVEWHKVWYAMLGVRTYRFQSIKLASLQFSDASRWMDSFQGSRQGNQAWELSKENTQTRNKQTDAG